MRDEKIREFLDEYEGSQGAVILDDASFDRSIAGLSDDGRIIYDYKKMVMEYMEDEQCSEEEACEWIDYNTLRAIPYMGEQRPIIMVMTAEEMNALCRFAMRIVKSIKGYFEKYNKKARTREVLKAIEEARIEAKQRQTSSEPCMPLDEFREEEVANLLTLQNTVTEVLE